MPNHSANFVKNPGCDSPTSDRDGDGASAPTSLAARSRIATAAALPGPSSSNGTRCRTAAVTAGSAGKVPPKDSSRPRNVLVTRLTRSKTRRPSATLQTMLTTRLTFACGAWDQSDLIIAYPSVIAVGSGV